MARPTQNTVDYFSHDCNHKQTMYILENKYKNDGYAFWFKLLESLGSAPNHFLDLNDEIACEFLAAKTNLDWSLCDEILTLLAKINAICPDLWAKKIVWCQKFVDRMAGVYAKRKKELPSKPSFCDGNDSMRVVSDAEIPQSKVNKTKLDKIKKENNTPAFFDKKASNDLPFIDDGEKKESARKKNQSMFEEFWQAYPKKTGKKKVAGIYERLMSREEVTHDELMRGINAYKKSDTVKRGFIKNPETWLNGGCWADEYAENDEESEWWGNDEIEQQIEDQLWIDDPVGMQRQRDAAMEAAAIAKKMAEEKKEQAKKAQEALK